MAVTSAKVVSVKLQRTKPPSNAELNQILDALGVVDEPSARRKCREALTSAINQISSRGYGFVLDCFQDEVETILEASPGMRPVLELLREHRKKP